MGFSQRDQSPNRNSRAWVERQKFRMKGARLQRWPAPRAGLIRPVPVNCSLFHIFSAVLDHAEPHRLCRKQFEASIAGQSSFQGTLFVFTGTEPA